ncbi:MAG: hypothetical protein ACLUTK_13335, partial [[Clostridium] leptum]
FYCDFSRTLRELFIERRSLCFDLAFFRWIFFIGLLGIVRTQISFVLQGWNQILFILRFPMGKRLTTYACPSRIYKGSEICRTQSGLSFGKAAQFPPWSVDFA